MDNRDKRLLQRVQADFPLDSHPFALLAAEFGLSEQEVLNKVEQWQKQGLIRHICPNFSPTALGFCSTLCAAEVAEEKLPAVAELINSFPEVTHNYRRDHAKNIWFTLIAENPEKLARTIAEIEKRAGIKIMSLPAEKVFKLKLQLIADEKTPVFKSLPTTT